MSLIKRFLEEVSVVIGDQGEINQKVMDIGEVALPRLMKKNIQKPWDDTNPQFVKVVKESCPTPRTS